jgi:hypothetical protein
MDNVNLKLERKDGDDKTFIFPVLPEELEVSGDGGNESINTIKQGEVTVFGDRKLRRFDIVSFFTANEAAPFCRAKGEQFRTPEECVNWIKALQEVHEPVWFIPEGLELDAFWVTVEAFRWKYATGKDIEYSISFKEYRPFGQRAKTLNRAPDIFATGERKVYESAGERREPTGWAIGDRVLVSGIYFSSPNGARAMLGNMADMPERYMARPWSAPLEASYKALSHRVTPLKAQRAVIIDIVKTQMISTPFDALTKTTIKSPCCYCIADSATQKRIGWVTKDQMTRI